MMKYLVLLIIFSLSCSSKECKKPDLSAFTHYEFNSEIELISDSLLCDIYDKPDGDIIFKLPPDEESGWELFLEESKGDYFKIKNVWSQKYIKSAGGEWSYLWKEDWMGDYEFVWIKKGKVGININNYDGTIVSIYGKPDSTSAVVGYVKTSQTVRVLEACAKWAKIEGVDSKEDKIRGWLAPEWQCSNPVTTCN